MLSSRRQALRRLRPHGRSTPLFQYLTLLCAVGVLLGIGTGIAGAASVARPDGLAAAGRPDRVLVKFRDGSSNAARSALVSSLGGSEVGVVRDLGVHVLSVPAGHGAAAVTALNSSAAVAFAEPDDVLTPQESIPDDPYFPQQYALDGGAWGWYQTHTTQAWDITQGSPAVVIAVLDTGLKTAGLSDFDGQVVPGWNVLNNSSDTSSNAGNHGTYVAGVVGLAGSNGTGNAGFCPGCKIMPVQVGTDAGAYLSDLASGLTWAADHGARVANMSWAGTSTSSTLQSAISYARSKGLVLTAAAGNSNCDCKTYPAAYAGVLAVGGTANSGTKAADSNYGTWVTLAAPEDNMTAWPTINGTAGYGAVGGTSLAAPVVAGIAGLLFSYNGALTNTQVEQALEATAAAVPFAVQYGRVDALAALQYLGATDPQPSAPPTQTAPARIYYEVNGDTTIAPLMSAPQPGQVLVRGIGGWVGSAGLAVIGLQWQRCSSSGLSCTALTSASTYAVQPADAGYALKLVFSVKNGVGSASSGVLTPVVAGTATTRTTTTTQTTTTTTATTSAPANTSPPTVSGATQGGQTLTSTTGSWSGNPTSYGYQWQRCDSSGAYCAAVAGGTSSTYVIQSTDVGSTLRVAVTAVNGGGSTTAASAPTTVVAAAPVTAPATQTLTFSGSLNPGNPTRSFNVTVGAGVADAQLSFSKCSSLSLGMSNGAGKSGPSVIVLDETLAAGSYTYTVGGGKCSFTLAVTAPSP